MYGSKVVKVSAIGLCVFNLPISLIVMMRIYVLHIIMMKSEV